MEPQGVSGLGVDWLPPRAALAFFEPPEGAYLSYASQAYAEARTRYGVRVGGLGLLIDPDAGSEMLAKPQIAPLPVSPPGFLGLINLRGNLVPLYDLRVLLGDSSRPPEPGARVLVLGKGDMAVGIIVEGYPSALSALRPASEMPSLPGALKNHVSAGYVQNNEVWLEFDHHSFFDDACGDMRMARS